MLRITHSIIGFFLFSNIAIADHCYPTVAGDEYCPKHPPDLAGGTQVGGGKAYINEFKEILRRYEGLTPEQRQDLEQRIDQLDHFDAGQMGR